MEPIIIPKNHPNRVGFRLIALLLNLQKRYFQTSVVAVILASLFSVIVVAPAAADGTTWTSLTSPAVNAWRSVTYGSGLFVAVSSDGAGNQVMTSPNGIDWTLRTSAGANIDWRSVTYGNGLFVAVGHSGSVMTSSDGITWTLQTTGVVSNNWNSVTYGNGRFVAVSESGTGNRVMTSSDGITWATQDSKANNGWVSVTYGTVGVSGLFVAVSWSGTNDRVMTSPDGITWTLRTPASVQNWRAVTYGNGLFVAVGHTNSPRVMTSTDGVTWVGQTTGVSSNGWWSVTYGNGLFVAVSTDGTTANSVMTSPDGITWTSRSSVVNNGWNSVTYANGLFVAVSWNGTVNSLRTSGTFLLPPAFTLTSSSESRTVNTAATGFTASSTGGAIASFAINATPPGMSFNTANGALTGTPSTVASATNYTITATNTSGSATRTFTLTVTAASVASDNSAAQAAAQTAAQAEAARKAQERKELTEILALIPKIGELTLSLGETTKSLYSPKCVKGKTTKFVKKGAKCPKGFVRKR